MIARYATPEMRALWSSETRYRTWLEVETAATEAWDALGALPGGSGARLRAAVEADPPDDAFAARVAELEARTRHDVVAFTRAVHERYGEAAHHVHRGLTSTDVVDTAQNLLLVRACDLILADLAALRERLRTLASRTRDALCIGRTHGVHAEPTTFGLKLLNFDAAAARDARRLRTARETIGVAMLSGSVGTYAHAPPEVEERVARQLGLAVDPITNQTVARDRHAELLAALALVGTTLERISLEIRHLQRTEVREVHEGFAKGQTGSSSMPHKKNPIASENLTGVARLLRAQLGPALEDVALWHERDVSHSSVERVVLPDATTLASYGLRRLGAVLDDLGIDEARMASNVDALQGLIYSQRVLHALVDAGMSREAAYEMVQRHALRCWDGEGSFRSLLASDPQLPLDDATLDAAFDPTWYLRHVDAVFARCGLPRTEA
ncbi:MAG: adenylosuccinate lyase [Trueperaceae bacterium]|nr:adenylosuccinate lyase [Trueperaceae bacterium]